MFAARGIAVSLSIFFLIYIAISLVVLGAWRRVWVWGQRHSAKSCADILFALRVAPLVVATGVTIVLAVPSFLLLEPRAVNEAMGGPSLWLGLCGLAVLLAGTWMGAAALIRASRTVARWSDGASTVAFNPAGWKRPVSVLRSSADAPPLITAGIRRPSVWLSRAAEFVLTERELQSALRHETVHVLRRDNLRKLILRVVAFPGMKTMENAWREATEMTADDSAVSSISEALDLAAAVIKLSRLASLQPPAELTTALVHSPAASVNARVERLIAWKDEHQNVSTGYSFACALLAATAVLASMVLTYSTLLVRMHAATEWLVR
jgi:beta-lactamase regulating signal transducer with metallopeptidase domain